MKIEKYRHTKAFDVAAKGIYQLLGNINAKEKVEFLYWQLKKWREGTLTNAHYEPFFTTYFGLDKDFYTNKKVMDIGCGPRGSLEWATNAAERIGLDPLAEKYLRLGADKQTMRYIAAGSEAIPFPDGYFDLVSSFNSLDHVDDLERAISEIGRVLRRGGCFLLIADIHEAPTITEPAAFSWDILEKFKPNFEVLSERHYEGHQLYSSIRAAVPFDHSDPTKRYGVLTAMLKKK